MLRQQLEFQFLAAQQATPTRGAAEETARQSGGQLMEGMIKLAAFSASPRYQKIRRDSAASLTRWLTVSSSVAAIANQQLETFRRTVPQPGSTAALVRPYGEGTMGKKVKLLAVKRAPASKRLFIAFCDFIMPA